MSTFVLIHGAGDVGWYWHLVEAELREGGHDVVAPDLPCDDDAAALPEYADAVAEAIGDRTDLVVVAQSLGGFTAPLPNLAGLGSKFLLTELGQTPECPSRSTLAELADRPGSDAPDAVRGHLARCPRCAQTCSRAPSMSTVS